MRILVTGFNRFGQLESNPTETMMEEVRRRGASLPDCELVAEVLETEFERAGRRIAELIAAHDPDAILGFGVSAKAQTFMLERFALNIDDAREPDNAGCAPPGEPIVADGPVAYASTLPLAELCASLKQTGVPVAYSNHAGTYVCNHVFYLICHHSAHSPRRRLSGFIHVPLAMDPPGSLAAGALECIAAVCRHLKAPQGPSAV